MFFNKQYSPIHRSKHMCRRPFGSVKSMYSLYTTNSPLLTITELMINNPLLNMTHDSRLYVGTYFHLLNNHMHFWVITLPFWLQSCTTSSPGVACDSCTVNTVERRFNKRWVIKKMKKIKNLSSPLVQFSFFVTRQWDKSVQCAERTTCVPAPLAVSGNVAWAVLWEADVWLR